MPARGAMPPLVWWAVGYGLWYQVRGIRLDGRPSPRRRFGRKALETFLSGGLASDDILGTDLEASFAGTPLLRGGTPDGHMPQGCIRDGVRVGVGRFGRSEEVEAASAAVRTFVGERVRIVGDMVLVRTPDPLFRIESGRLQVDPFPRMTGFAAPDVPLAPPGYRLDQVEAGTLWEGGEWTRKTERAARGRDWTRAMEKRTNGADAAVTVACPDGGATAGTHRAAFDAIASTERELHRWNVEAMVGGIDARNASAAVRLAGSLLRVINSVGTVVERDRMAFAEADRLVRRFEDFELAAAAAERRRWDPVRFFHGTTCRSA